MRRCGSPLKVEIDKLPNANLADKLTVSFASGSPDYDVLMMDETWIAGLAAYLTDVDNLVAVPLAAPGIAVTAIFAFLLGWNEFLFL